MDKKVESDIVYNGYRFGFQIESQIESIGYRVWWVRNGTRLVKAFQTKEEANHFVKWMEQNEDKITYQYLVDFYSGKVPPIAKRFLFV